MDIRVLGPLEVRVDGTPIALGGPKPRLLVAMLVQALGTRVSTEALLAALYGEHPPGGGRRTVQTYVSKLRRGFGEALHSAAGGYVLDVDPTSVDAVRFETTYRAATARVVDQPDRAAVLLRDALASWRGHAYADVDAEGPIVAEVTRLHELRLAATEARLDADLALGRHDQVLGELEALVAQHPLRERFHAQRMLALYRAGRQADALQAFSAVRTRLVDELGLDPSEELRDLERRMLAQDAGLLLEDRRVERRAVVVTDIDPEHWDDADVHARLRRRDEVIASRADRDGTIVEGHGTAVVVTLTEVGRAVDLAATLARDAEGMRIAVDHGDVEQVRGGVSGPPVTRAARVVALGHPGQVLLTAAAQAQLAASAQPGRTLTSLGTHAVSGLGEPVALFQLQALGLPGPFPALRTGRLPPPIPVPVAGSLPGHELRGQLVTTTLGTLHLAYQPAVGREVAVFVVDAALARDADFVRQFEVEAQRLARLTHPHIVGLLDHWRTPEQAVLVFRHVDSSSLGSVAAAGLPAGEVSTILEQVAEALDHAHGRGVVHGAVGAASVRLDGDGNVWVSGVGVRQVCGATPGAWVHELAAPEVLDGSAASPRTDVYGLGLLAHHLLSGEAPPLDGALPPVRPGVDEVIATLTAPRPEDRPASAGEAVARLQSALGQRARPRMRIAARNPYRGLEPFTELDAQDFHGRAAVVAELVRTLRGQRVVTVAGPSGIGKSSLVRAGLVPSVRAGAVGGDVTWVVAYCTPGDRPLDRLAAALRRVALRPADGLEKVLASGGASGLRDAAALVLPQDARLLIVIDQFEELFHGTADDPHRDRFLGLLCGLAASDAPVRVVLTLRADALGRPLEHARFAKVVRDGLVPVGAPGPEELAEIVRGPAAGVGVEVEPSLVARIVADAEGQPGALPLVEHLLTELFEDRDRRAAALRLEDYLDAGGIRGAIGRRAERVFTSLDAHQRDAARELFLQLVSVGDDGTVARRRVEWPGLVGRGASADAVEEAMERFGASRLLTFDHEPTTRIPTVELAHEALVREWDRLAAWIEDAHTDLVDRHRLESAAAAWTVRDRDEADLLRGSRLLAAEERLRAERDALAPDVAALVAASRARADEKEVAAQTRRRRTTTALASMLVVALALGGVAVQRWRSEAATSATARARELAGLSTLTLDVDPERAVLLALEAVRIARDRGPAALPEARSALEVAGSRHRVRARIPGAGVRVAVSPDGTAIATSGQASSFHEDSPDGPDGVPTDVAIWSPAGERSATIEAGGPVDDVAWVGDDRVAVLSGVVDGRQTVVVHDGAGDVVGALRFPDVTVGGNVRLEAGAGLVVVSTLAESVAWDADTGEVVAVAPAGDHLTVSDDGRLVAWDDAATWTIDPATGTTSTRVDLPIDAPSGLAVVREGRFATIDRTDDALVVVDLATGSGMAAVPVDLPTGFVTWVDDDRVAATSNTGRLVVLDVTTGTAQTWHPTVAGGNWDLAADRGGTVLAVSSDWAGDLAVIDPSPGAGDPTLSGQAWLHADPSHDLVLANLVGGVRALDTTDGVVDVLLDGVATPLPHPPVRSSADGSTVAWVDDQLRGRIRGPDLDITLPACHGPRVLRSDGRLVAVDTRLPGREECSTADLGHVLDTVTGVTTTLPTGGRSDADVLTGEFGPVGTAAEGLLVLTRDFRRADVVDVPRGVVLASFRPVEGALLGGVVSPDGTLAVWGSSGGVLTLVDLVSLRRSGELDRDEHVRHLDVGGQVALGLDVDGDLIAAVVDGSQVLVVDHATGEHVARFAPLDPVGVALHRGSLYYTEGDVLRSMPMDIDEAVAEATASLTRSWTPEECTEYAIPGCGP